MLNKTLTNRALICSAGLALLAGPALAEEGLSIADLAPQNAFIVVGTDDASAGLDAFKETTYFEIWNAPETREWLDSIMAEPMAEFEEAMASLDIELDDLSEPQGMAGLSAWLVQPAPEAEGNDALPMHFLAAADFGDGIDDMQDAFEKLLEDAEEEGDLTYTSEELGEATIFTIVPTEAAMDDMDDADDWGDGGDDWGEWDEFDAGPSMPEIEEIFVARTGSHMLIGSSLTDLENALSRIEGVAFDALSETSSYARLKPYADNHHGYAIIVNDPLYTLTDEIDAFNTEQQTGMPAIMGILDAAGLAEVRGIAAGISLNEETGESVTELFVSAPRLRGLMGLFNVPERDFNVPSFVSADVASFNMLQVDLANLFPTLQQIVNGLPAELAQQAQFMLPMAQQQLGPILSNLGPEIYITQEYMRPYSVDSQQQLVAIAAKDTEALTNALTGLAPMLGLEGRDFQGNQIWSMGDMGGGMMGVPAVALGVGFGHFFVGPEASVETAMRQGAAGPSELAANDRFEEAMSTVAGNGLAFGYTNIQETAAYMSWTRNNMDQIVDAQIEQMFGEIDDEAFKAEMRESMMEQMAVMENIPDFGKWADELGDTAMIYELVDGGIKATIVNTRAD